MKKLAILLAIAAAGVMCGWRWRGMVSPPPNFGSYEEGAHAVMLHHKLKGDYGSGAYRRRAFAWGSPQNEQDIDAILESTR